VLDKLLLVMPYWSAHQRPCTKGRAYRGAVCARAGIYESWVDHGGRRSASPGRARSPAADDATLVDCSPRSAHQSGGERGSEKGIMRASGREASEIATAFTMAERDAARQQLLIASDFDPRHLGDSTEVDPDRGAQETKVVVRRELSMLPRSAMPPDDCDPLLERRALPGFSEARAMPNVKRAPPSDDSSRWPSPARERSRSQGCT